MLIPFTDCLQFCKDKPIRGILHIGAHRLEEKFFYNLHGIDTILWVEAQEQLVKEFEKENKIYQLVVSDIDNEEVVFHVSNNGQSSSILEFGSHSDSHPDVKFIKDIPMKTTRMDTFIKRENIDIKLFNFLNLDIQGVELKAMKGFGDLLNNIDYIYSEVNDSEVYKGCDLVHEIDEYLSIFGFVGVKTIMAGNAGWGDKFYVKK